MKTLYLNVEKEFFDMYKTGIKKEDYRAIKKYWVHRLIDLAKSKDAENGNTPIRLTVKVYDFVQIKNGYQKNAPTLLFKWEGTDIGLPNPEWIGNKFDREKHVFRIKIGKLINNDNSNTNNSNSSANIHNNRFVR